MIRVLVVDDSALMRSILSRVIPADGTMEVVGTAVDPDDARRKIRSLRPDVLTLDIEMPGMNGLAFLQKLMRLYPMPVVMVSTLTHKGTDATLLALELGAVDFVPKPSASLEDAIEPFGRMVRGKLRAAAASTVRRPPAAAPPPGPRCVMPSGAAGALVALGASTGGVDALRAVLTRMPVNGPPILIAQHMPDGFTQRMAARLTELTGLNVVEAADGMILEPGAAYVARGGHDLTVVRTFRGPACRVSAGDDAPGNHPSVDALFESVAAVAGAAGVGAILTGMGRDGARGLLAMRVAGAGTIGQNQATSLVYGMPRVAFEEGAVAEQVPLDAIADRLVAALVRQNAAA